MVKPSAIQESMQQPFNYRSFYENLQKRLEPEEMDSMNVLGEEFFYLVDRLSVEFYIRKGGDCLLLEIPKEEFLWELQIFINGFIRKNCGSPLKLKGYCQQIKACLTQDGFQQEYVKVLEDAYQDHFYLQESTQIYLV